MLASTIQFTTNPPTPGSHHPHKAAEHGPGNQGALPQNPDSMPPPHAPRHAGHPPPADHHDHNSPSSPPQRACFLHQTHQATNPTREKQASRDTVSRPAFREEQPPAGPDPFNSLSKIKRPGSHPHHQSLERR